MIVLLVLTQNLGNGTYRLNVTFGALNVPFDVEYDIEFFCFDNIVRYSTIASQSSNYAGLSDFNIYTERIITGNLVVISHLILYKYLR